METQLMEQKLNKKFIRVQSICIIGAILVHTNNIDLYGLNNSQSLLDITLYWVEEWLSNYFGNFIAVPVFFMISGFLFFDRVCDYSCTLPKIRKRLYSLGIPYIVWNTIGTVFFLIIIRIPTVSQFVNSVPDPITIRNICLGILLYKYYYICWFLFRLIIYTWISPFLCYVLRKKSIGIAALLISALLIAFFPQVDPLTTRSLFFFLFGGFSAYHIRDWFCNQTKKRKSYFLILALLGTTVIYFLIDNFAGKMIITIVAPILFWDSLNIADYNDIYLYHIERNIFYIYVSHMLILELVEKTILIIFGNNTIGAYFDYLFAPVFTVLILSGLFVCIKKLFPDLLSILCGGRV